jgi:hypothetical protein
MNVGMVISKFGSARPDANRVHDDCVGLVSLFD